MPRRPVPRDDVQRRSATRSRTSATRSGTASRSCPGSASRTSRSASPGMPSWASKEGLDPTPEARALGATCGGVRVWSLYVPNGRTLADPHLQYKLEWLEALRTTAAGWLAEGRRRRRSPWSATGTSRPENDDVWDMAVFAHSTHVSAARAGRVPGASWRPGTPTSSGRTRPGPASTRTGTTRSCASRAARACGSTSSSAPPRSPAGSTGALIDREERKGKGASDHAPVIVELA